MRNYFSNLANQSGASRRMMAKPNPKANLLSTMDKKKASAKKPKLGSGKRFASLKKKLGSRKGKKKVKNPSGLAAYIGRKKFGAGKMARMAAAGHRRKG